MPSALTDRGILDGDCPRIEVEPAQAEIEKARELARCWSKHFDLSPDCAALPLCGQPSVHAAGDPVDVRHRDGRRRGGGDAVASLARGYRATQAGRSLRSAAPRLAR